MLIAMLVILSASDSGQPGLDRLTNELGGIATRHGVPALAVYASHGNAVREAAWGVRKQGDATPVEIADRWHLGSDTKAMTATLAALLVEEGKLAWNTTVGTALAEWQDLDPAFATITLEMLLSHRAGLAANLPDDLRKLMWKPKDPGGQRSNLIHALLRRPPDGKVGEFSYSNAGYMVAGVMLEKVGGDTWESLMRERLFEPLGMRSCGFGPPASPEKVDAPWAHRVRDGKLEPVPPGRGSDNPPAMGPAGTVHCALKDWHAFVDAHARGERGATTRLGLSRAAFEKLHAAIGPTGSYALGWGVTAHPRWPTARALAHDGSNTMFYASVMAIPSENIVVLAAANRGDDEAKAAIKEAMDLLTAAD